MGGDSVLAIRLSAKLRDQGIQLSSASLLGKLPIEALANQLLQQEIQQEQLETTPLERGSAVGAHATTLLGPEAVTSTSLQSICDAGSPFSCDVGQPHLEEVLGESGRTS